MDSEELKGLPECHTVLVWPHYQFLGTLYIDLKFRKKIMRVMLGNVNDEEE